MAKINKPKKKKESEIPPIREMEGFVTAVGSQVNDTGSTMYIEVNGSRVNFPKGKKVSIKVEK